MIQFLEEIKGQIKRVVLACGVIIRHYLRLRTLDSSVFFDEKDRLKVYTYKLPYTFWPRSSLALPSQTYYAHQDFFERCVATDDPEKADYYFVPLNIIEWQFRNKDPKQVIEYLKYMTDKKDHIIVAVGDLSNRTGVHNYGTAYKEIYTWLDKFMLLALESTSDLIPGQDIGIIPYNTLQNNHLFNNNQRPYLYSFIGELDHIYLPKSHVRSTIKKLPKKTDVYIESMLAEADRSRLLDNFSTDNDYELVSRNSIFTLCPAGYGKWPYRLFQSIAWGSIPVVISDDYIKPFGDVIPWDDFCITIPENKAQDIDEILRSISQNKIQHYQEELKNNQNVFTPQNYFNLLAEALLKVKK